MITLNASSDFNTAGKQYIARIKGRDSKFTFDREFIGKRSGKRNDFTSADVDDPGLYELRDTTRKGTSDKYRLIVAQGDELVVYRCSKEEAMKIARLLDEGVSAHDLPSRLTLPDDRESGDIGFVTAAQAERAVVAQTIDSVVAACWAAIEPLPEKERKRVLAELRARVNPPKAIEAPAAEPVPAPDAGEATRAD